MKKFLAKSFLFAIITIIGFQFIGTFFNLASKKNGEEKINWILSKKDQKYDFAFLGNSRVLTMVDVNYLQNSWGELKGINLGSTGSSFAENYATLYEFYKNKNNIDNLFLQIDEKSLDPQKGFIRSFQEQLFFNFMGDAEIDKIYIDQSGNNKFLLWKYAPFTRYAEFNEPYKNYALSMFLHKKIDYDSTFGSQITGEINSQQKLPKRVIKNWQVSEIGVKYFEKIIKLAEEHNTNIILYTAPYYKKHNNEQPINSIEKYIQNIALKNSFTFLNFRRSKVSEDTQYFNDEEHLNKVGTALFMTEFAPEAERTLR